MSLPNQTVMPVARVMGMNSAELERIFAGVPSGLLVLSADLRVLSANPSFRKMFGQGELDLPGQPLEAVLPAAGLREQAADVLATGKSRHDIAVALENNEGTRLVRITITEMLEEEETRLLLIIDNLTEAEEQLRATAQACEQRFLDLVHGLDAIVWEADATTHTFSFVSQRAEEILGYPIERWLTEPNFWVKLVHPEDREQTRDFYRAATSAGGNHQFEYRAVTMDGRVLWLRDIVHVVRDEKGQALQLRGVMLDTTERKKAEETRAQLIAILDATTDFVAITNVTGRARYINKSGRKMLGINSNEDTPDVAIPDFCPAWARTLILNEAFPAAVRDGVWSGETAFMSRDGREIPVSQVILAHKTPDGSIEFLSTIARDISERKRFEGQLIYLADHDALTGIFNRRRFQQELSRQLAYALRYGPGGAVLFLDLDDFKYVNDSLGHRAGDELLATLADLLRVRLRETDVHARLGGDEFAILLPQADADQAQAVAEQILQAVGCHTVVVDGQPIGITASIGIALFPEHGKTVEELLAHADLAMYRAKEDNHNHICLYAPDQDYLEKKQVNLTWKARIREALEEDRFVLYLQPLLDLRHNRISRYEALLRMVGNTGELILPADFLDVAERFGLIRDIDRWVVRQAIRLIADHHRTGRNLCLEVNLSGKAFADPQLLPLIQQELAMTSIDPANLMLEITETAAITNIREAQNFIAALKSLGCRFLLDDFGVGFSSFNYLKQLPVDCLKIDGSFIRDLPRDPVDQHLVKAMVEVARGLGKHTVAECVGDAETVQLLRELGVDYAQGYYISWPGPVSEILAASPIWSEQP